MKARGIVEELSDAFACARGFLSSILDLFLVVAAWLGLMAALALWAVAVGFWMCARVSRDLLYPRRPLRAKRLELV